MTAAGLEISTDRSRLDIDVIHTFLSQQSYWAQGRPRAAVEQTIQHSLCFGAYLNYAQVGFGRVVTDYAVIGYVADVFVLPAFRRRGIGKALVKAIVEHPSVAGLKVVLLRSMDSRSLYAQFGFTAIPQPEEMMSRCGAVVQQGGVATDGSSPRR